MLPEGEPVLPEGEPVLPDVIIPVLPELAPPLPEPLALPEAPGPELPDVPLSVLPASAPSLSPHPHDAHATSSAQDEILRANILGCFYRT